MGPSTLDSRQKDRLQTRHLVVDSYLLSAIKFYRQLFLSNASIPDIRLLDCFLMQFPFLRETVWFSTIRLTHHVFQLPMTISCR